jgi:hypothetical protein
MPYFGNVALLTGTAMDEVGIKIAQIITVATAGVGPSAAQVAGWEAYWQAGHPLTEIAAAFVQSTNFANAYNNGTLVDPSSAASPAILQNVMNYTLGSHTSTQIDAWVSTGLHVADVLTDFALGDQYTHTFFDSLSGGDGATTVINTSPIPVNIVGISDVPIVIPPWPL